MSHSRRAFVLHHTRLQPIPGLEEIRLHLSGEVLRLWHAVQLETQDPDAALPYWAIAWGGGLAVGRYLREHPEVVAGRRVFDLASGSGLCAIAAMRAGAAEATGVDIDAFAVAAMELNARANGCRVTALHRDVLDEEPPAAGEIDVILAGDCWYEERLARRVLPWLERARARGVDVLLGDPGRRYLPTGALRELASYDVATTSDLEDLDHRQGHVYSFLPLRSIPTSLEPATGGRPSPEPARALPARHLSTLRRVPAAPRRHRSPAAAPGTPAPDRGRS